MVSGPRHLTLARAGDRWLVVCGRTVPDRATTDWVALVTCPDCWEAAQAAQDRADRSRLWHHPGDPPPT